MGSWNEVAQFLSSFKVALDFGFLELVEREKNLQGLVDLGLTIQNAKEVLVSLTPENYWYGPERDRQTPTEDVWFFGADIGGTEAYIKLKLAKDPRKKHVYHAKVLSFHPATGPISYPLRGGGT